MLDTIKIITPICTAIIGWCVASLKRDRKEQKAISNGVGVLLRSRLIDLHERYVIEAQPCSIDVKQEADGIYVAYHELGLNGMGTELHRQILEAHIKTNNKGVEQ